jgi:chromosomal replication initiation ATPase DnaA
MINYMAIPGISRPNLTIDRIKNIVCEYYNISVEDLKKKNKSAKYFYTTSNLSLFRT